MPDEFITQRVDIANPPTLILVIESLLDKLEKRQSKKENISHSKNSDYKNDNSNQKLDNKEEKVVCESIDNDGNIDNQYCMNNMTNNENKKNENENNDVLLYEFLNEIYPALSEWVTWYLNSQVGPRSTVEMENDKDDEEGR